MLDPMTLRGPLPAGLALAAVLCAAPSPASGADVPVDLELVLAVDVSGSVDEVEAHLQREGYVAAFGHPQVVEAIEAGPTGRIAVTYVEWAGQHHQETLVGWTLIEDKESAGTFASAIAETPLISARWTSLSGALDYAKTLFDGNGFEGLRRVIDVSGDGTNNSGRPVTDAREEALATGLTINGLPIVNDRLNPWGGLPAADLDVYYERFVIGGPGAFIVVAEDYTKFAEAILSKLILEIADTAPPAEGTRHAAALAARLP